MFGYCVEKGWIGGVGLLLILSLGCFGCSRWKKDTPPSREEERMLALLSIAKSHHRLASLALQRRQQEQAIREINEILNLRFPQGFRPGEEMLLDAWARKAEIYLGHGQSEQALKTIDAAIARPSWLKHSYYLAHLHQVRGQILESMKRPKDAVNAYQKSILLNKAVIQEIEQQRQ